MKLYSYGKYRVLEDTCVELPEEWCDRLTGTNPRKYAWVVRRSPTQVVIPAGSVFTPKIRTGIHYNNVEVDFFQTDNKKMQIGGFYISGPVMFFDGFEFDELDIERL